MPFSAASARNQVLDEEAPKSSFWNRRYGRWEGLEVGGDE